MLANSHLSTAALVCVALSLLGALRLGASIYEISVVDPAWPSKPALIQPLSGGIDRKRFWVVANSLFEVALVGSWVVGWSVPGLTMRLLLPTVSYGVMRGWSFAYFIPAALRFERGSNGGPDFERSAYRWTFLSRFRAVLDLLALVGCLVASAAALNAAGT